MRLLSALRASAIAGLLGLSVPGGAVACAFHTTLPEATLTEDIARSVEVIAARPSAADPFRYEPVAVLRGEASGQGPPVIVDSVTRTRLLRNPDEAVLFARGSDGTWTRRILLDAATRPIVERMIARADAWASANGAAERRDIFAALLAHPDARLRGVALRELDALPYDVLRGGTYPVAAEDLLRGLSDIDQMPFAPIRILLLGLDSGDVARDAISRRLDLMADLKIDMNLGAWITAALESGGEAGMADVERLFLGDRTRIGEAQLTETLRAFAVTRAQGDPALRPAIDGAVRRLASLQPSAAPIIVQAFGANADYSQIDLVRDLVKARAFTDIGGLMAAAAYVNGAALAGPANAPDPGPLQSTASR